MKEKGARTAPFVSTMRRRLKVTHPFHPLFDQEFEFVGFCNSWKKECVQFSDANGSLFSLPLEWTDAAGVDPFLRVSQGRSHFRVEELLRLVDLVAAIASLASTRPSKKT
jgi:hypothetical protein